MRSALSLPYLFFLISYIEGQEPTIPGVPTSKPTQSPIAITIVFNRSQVAAVPFEVLILIISGAVLLLILAFTAVNVRDRVLVRSEF